MVKPKVVLLIFVSGKVVLTGAKVRLSMPASSLTSQTREDINVAWSTIYPVLADVRKCRTIALTAAVPQAAVE